MLLKDMRLPVLESSSSVNSNPDDPSVDRSNSQRAHAELWTVASQHTRYGKQNYARPIAAELVVKRDAVTVRTSSDIAINWN